MKNARMIRKHWFAAFFLVASIQSYAGSEGGNGGDMCEDRFKSVRDDIAAWIKKGGSSGLTLTPGLALETYNSEMLTQISNARISCTDDTVMIGTAEKTCKNALDSSDRPFVLCNNARFMGTSESDQYVLVHHEYAGLAGFEVNVGEESQYPLSNQLSGYLIDEVVKKLAVNPVASGLGKVKSGFIYATPKVGPGECGIRLTAQVADSVLMAEYLNNPITGLHCSGHKTAILKCEGSRCIDQEPNAHYHDMFLNIAISSTGSVATEEVECERDENGFPTSCSALLAPRYSLPTSFKEETVPTLFFGLGIVADGASKTIEEARADALNMALSDCKKFSGSCQEDLSLRQQDGGTVYTYVRSSN